ncbi:hypothetical protein [Maritalea sp.]|uniref:hypothetical protein n=1 Tax=Maritalea sp. TaxID=2003361 RepID=UPI003EFAA933
MHKDRHQELTNLRQQLHRIEQSGGQNAGGKSAHALKTGLSQSFTVNPVLIFE